MGDEEKDPMSEMEKEALKGIRGPVTPDQVSSNALLEEKDKEIERLTSVNKDLLREIQLQKEKAINFEQKLINLVIASREDNKSGEEVTPDKPKRRKRIKKCRYELEELGSCKWKHLCRFSHPVAPQTKQPRPSRASNPKGTGSKKINNGQALQKQIPATIYAYPTSGRKPRPASHPLADKMEDPSRKQPAAKKNRAPPKPTPNHPKPLLPRPFRVGQVGSPPAPFPVPSSPAGKNISANSSKPRPNYWSKPRGSSPPNPVKDGQSQVGHRGWAKQKPITSNSQSGKQAAIRSPTDYPATGANATPLPFPEEKRDTLVSTLHQINSTLLQLAGYADEKPTRKDVNKNKPDALDLSVRCKRCGIHHSQGRPCGQ